MFHMFLQEDFNEALDGIDLKKYPIILLIKNLKEVFLKTKEIYPLLIKYILAYSQL